MSRILKSYYIGDPDPDTTAKRGQDKNGMVHCLCWMQIYKKGYGITTKNKLHLVAVSGGGIGYAKNLKEAKQMVKEYASDYLEILRIKTLDELKRIEKAKETIDLYSSGLDSYEGEYHN